MGVSQQLAMAMRALSLALLAAVAVQVQAGGLKVQGWTVPSTWQQGQDFVVVQSGDSASAYGGYIFPGPTSSHGASYASPDGYICEAKHYDHNHGIFATADCANRWTKLTLLGDEAGETMEGCATVASRPCGCQSLCRPVNCTVEQIHASNQGDHENGCDYHRQCQRQEQLGLVTSCTDAHNFQFSLWFGVAFTVIVAFGGFAMANMPLDMDSLLYTVGNPDDKAHQN